MYTIKTQRSTKKAVFIGTGERCKTWLHVPRLIASVIRCNKGHTDP